ncbi:MAG: hypothetical protein GY755_22165, partial [Chloroflexi bacterium]|nr:hypothetical protein [Chloroflexota bacterium]
MWAQGFLDFRNLKRSKKPCGRKMPPSKYLLLDPLSAHEPKKDHFWPFLTKTHFRPAKKLKFDGGILWPHGFLDFRNLKRSKMGSQASKMGGRKPKFFKMGGGEKQNASKWVG